jgi:serine/threonine protein kinase
MEIEQYSFDTRAPPLAQGTYGSVYAGVRGPMGRAGSTFVVKRFILGRRRDEADYRGRHVRQQHFFAEMDVLQHVPPHLHLPRLLAAAQDGDDAFVVLEHGGQSLCLPDTDDIRPAIGMNTSKALAIGLQVASAVAHLHAHGFSHGDIKPANVLVRHDPSVVPGGVKAMLIDFGFSSRATNSFVVAPHKYGSPLFAAPDVLEGDVPHLMWPADVWAIGCLLYYMLTGGRLPHDSQECQTLAELRRRRSGDARLPPMTAAAVGPSVDRIIARALRFSPWHRPSAADMLRVLTTVQPSGGADSPGRHRVE